MQRLIILLLVKISAILLLTGCTPAVEPKPLKSSALTVPALIGQPATPKLMAIPPRNHPFMAAPGQSTIRSNGFNSDVHQKTDPLPGPEPDSFYSDTWTDFSHAHRSSHAHGCHTRVAIGTNTLSHSLTGKQLMLSLELVTPENRKTGIITDLHLFSLFTTAKQQSSNTFI